MKEDVLQILVIPLRLKMAPVELLFDSENHLVFLTSEKTKIEDVRHYVKIWETELKKELVEKYYWLKDLGALALAADLREVDETEYEAARLLSLAPAERIEAEKNARTISKKIKIKIREEEKSTPARRTPSIQSPFVKSSSKFDPFFELLKDAVYSLALGEYESFVSYINQISQNIGKGQEDQITAEIGKICTAFNHYDRFDWHLGTAQARQSEAWAAEAKAIREQERSEVLKFIATGEISPRFLKHPPWSDPFAWMKFHCPDLVVQIDSMNPF